MKIFVLLFLYLLHPFIIQDPAEKVFSFNEIGNDDFSNQLKGKKVIFIGEIHGTNESPEFIYALAKKISERGVKISVGLEISEAYQNQIDSFFTAGNKEIITKMEFFNSGNLDGRSSIAMASLIYNLRKIKGIRCFCFDIGKNTGIGISQRDSIMAENIYKNLYGELTLVLTGNVHARLKKNSKGDSQNYKPAAFILKNKYNLADSIISLNTYLGKGTAWFCSKGNCGKTLLNKDVELSRKYKKNVVVFCKASDKFGYHGYIYIKKASASKPLN